MIIDPWSSQLINYSKLFDDFGMQKMDEGIVKKASALAAKGGTNLHYLDRGIMFAHRDFGSFIASHGKGNQVAAMSGIKPSSEFHLGSKMTAEELILFQKAFGAKVFYSIADMEAMADNRMGYDETHVLAVSNVADLLALGLDEKNAYVYKQSQELRIHQTSFIASIKVTNSMLKAIYGEKEISLYLSALVQIGDILLPQHEDFGGPKNVVVPVGADQDPHIRLARDIASKLGLVLPSSTYHRFIRALDGNFKMSKRIPDSMLSLGDRQEDIKRKVRNVLTGGRNTAAEQKEKGGELEKCVFFEICYVHFLKDGKQVEEMRSDCLSGKNLCGECKAKYGKEILEFFEKHQEKKAKLMPKAEKLIGIE